MSAIGDTLTITSGLTVSKKGINATASGLHSSSRKTFLPAASRRAGSRYTASGPKAARDSFQSEASGLISKPWNSTFSSPRAPKLPRTASSKAASLSLNHTREERKAKAQPSTPSPPVRSATLPPQGSNPALYRAVPSEEHCWKFTARGTSISTPAHEGTFASSFPRSLAPSERSISEKPPFIETYGL